MDRSRPLLIVVTGPTASGKTSLAIDLAQRLGCDIISADSRQIYKGLSIGTAAPTPSERALATHHLVDILDLDQYYSAAQFEIDALRLLPEQFEKASGYAVVCGGSMMYVDALINGIDEMPTVTQQVRERVQTLAQQHGAEGLLALLEIVDPTYFGVVDRDNLKRVMHALEVSIQAGKPYSSFRTGEKRQRDFDVLKLAIDRPRQELFDRINRRVDLMIENGLVDEARSVYGLRNLNSLNTVGYKEMFVYFDGNMDFTTAVERIKKNTRVYAKKQMTWLRKDADVRYLSSVATAQDVLKIIN